MIERFGLFTIIALGEPVVAMVPEVNYKTYNPLIFVVSFFALLIVVQLKTIYFEVDSSIGEEGEHAVERGKLNLLGWILLHLPM